MNQLKTIFLMFTLLPTISVASIGYQKLRAFAWIRGQLDDIPGSAVFYGVTKELKLCELSVQEYRGDVIIIVANDMSPEERKVRKNEIIGLDFEKRSNEVQIEIEGYFDKVKLSHNQSFGNDSKRNMVTIEINDTGKPVSAIGESDLHKIECFFRKK